MTLPSPHFELGADGIARSKQFDDVYASTAGAFAQAQRVYVQGCDLPARFASNQAARVLELGFGLGVNFLATAAAFLQHAPATQPLDYVGIEGFPVSHAELSTWLATLKRQLPNLLCGLADELISAWPDATKSDVCGWHTLRLAGGRIRLTLIFDDVHRALLQMPGGVDTVYLDGFAPSKNPAMWQPRVLAQVRGKLNPGAHLASYSVASAPLQTLRELGLDVKKLPGFAHKRECLQARLLGAIERQTQILPNTAPRKRIVIVGAGIAGLALAYRLAREHKCSSSEAVGPNNSAALEITVIEREQAFAGASGAPAVLLHAPTSSESSVDFALHTLAFRHAVDCLRELSELGVDTGWQPLRIAQARKGELSVEAPFGGRLLPRMFSDNVRAYLQTHHAIRWLHADVQGISGQRGAWQVQLNAGARFECDEIALCTGYSQAAFMPDIGMRFVQGQIETVLPEQVLTQRSGSTKKLSQVARSAVDQQVLKQRSGSTPQAVQPGRAALQGFDAWCGQSVVVPLANGRYALGNSFERGMLRTDPDPLIREQLIRTAREALDWQTPLQCEASWRGTRAQCEARLPRIGLHPSGMHLSLAHASKGFITAFLAANWISAQLAQRPLDVPLGLQAKLKS
jgi:tRNA U34 5-methylaminomethyl-2-thiouridine-forming methyltransferase MnmC/glycine/D-amino acid oxidase-like deaminating enzyme